MHKISLDDYSVQKKGFVEQLRDEYDRQKGVRAELLKIEELQLRHSPSHMKSELLKPSSFAYETSVALHEAMSLLRKQKQFHDSHLPKSIIDIDRETARTFLGAGLAGRLIQGSESSLQALINHRSLINKLQVLPSGSHVSVIGNLIESHSQALNLLLASRGSIDRISNALDGADSGVSEEDVRDVKLAALCLTQVLASKEILRDFADLFISSFPTWRDSPVQALLIWLCFDFFSEPIRKLFLTVIVSGINATIHMRANDPTLNNKTIQQIASTSVSPMYSLADHRYVSVKSLVMRLNPNARSPKIASLTYGQVVRLEKKVGDFALVVWVSGEVELQGWVFARYLKKFN